VDGPNGANRTDAGWAPGGRTKYKRIRSCWPTASGAEEPVVGVEPGTGLYDAPEASSMVTCDTGAEAKAPGPRFWTTKPTTQEPLGPPTATPVCVGAPAVADTFCPAGPVAVWARPAGAASGAGVVGEMFVLDVGGVVSAVLEGVAAVVGVDCVVLGEADPWEEQPAPIAATSPNSPTPTSRGIRHPETPWALPPGRGHGAASSAGFAIGASA
jgi:hypothetical protein